MKRHLRGLTLIELMVVVAVIAILATIAIISWGRFVQRAARSDAMSALLDLGVRQEQFRLANPFFAEKLTALPKPPDVAATSRDEECTLTPGGKYLICIEAADTATFLATAEPQGSQEADKAECGEFFAINQDGPLTTGTYADAACWKR